MIICLILRFSHSLLKFMQSSNQLLEMSQQQQIDPHRQQQQQQQQQQQFQHDLQEHQLQATDAQPRAEDWVNEFAN